MTRIAAFILIGGLLMAGPAPAAGPSGSTSGEETEPSPLLKATERISAGDYNGAIPILQTVLEEDERNADAYNWLGYAHRQLGNLMDSKRAYDKALAIDPVHKGAHEYLGELYLQMDQLEKAEQQLRRLDEICGFFGCAEYDDLRAAIKAYKREKS